MFSSVCLGWKSLVKDNRIITRFNSGPISLVSCLSNFFNPSLESHTVCGFTGVHHKSLPSSRIVILTICSWACSMFHLISALSSYAVNIGVFIAFHYAYTMPSAICLCFEPSVSHGEHSLRAYSNVQVMERALISSHLKRKKSYLMRAELKKRSPPGK